MLAIYATCLIIALAALAYSLRAAVFGLTRPRDDDSLGYSSDACQCRPDDEPPPEPPLDVPPRPKPPSFTPFVLVGEPDAWKEDVEAFLLTDPALDRPWMRTPSRN